MNVHRKLYLSAAGVLLVGLFAWSQTEKLSSKNKLVSEGKREQIEVELKALGDHPWAGEYYYGDGLGVNVALVLAPKAGFAFSWHGCLGLYDQNYGTVEVRDGRIRLHPMLPNDAEGRHGRFRGTAEEFVPVAWGDRHYLVPTTEMLAFVNDINSGIEPRRNRPFGRFLRRNGDEERTAGGRPDIPPEFLEYLLVEPVETRIVRAGSSSESEEDLGGNVKVFERITSVSLDKGQAEGLRDGMRLFVKTARADGYAIVTAVSSHSSQAKLIQSFKDGAVPAVGWKLSTRMLTN